MGKCKVFMLSLCRQIDRQTTVKQYAPDLPMWGHKNDFFQMIFGQTSIVLAARFEVVWGPQFKHTI